MRIGCLQFAPQVGDVDNNLNRADSVLSKANPDGLDLLVLPELAFSGYNFNSLQHISPFLEPSGSGITSLWARTTALKYNCNVVAGYPEKVDVSGSWPTGPEYYNSAIVVNEDGETIANYRKSFLYYTDETWALEGTGFYDGFIPGLGRTSIGICMDLNPYKFRAPWHAFEFGFHILQHESNLVIVSMAWMTREDSRTFSRMPNEPDMDTLTYWVTRLEPLIRAEREDEIIVVFCNRTGMEDDVVYAGTSAVIGVQDGEVKIYGLLGRGEKELLVVDTKNAPYAKLVYRPEAERPSIVHTELQQMSYSPSSPAGPAPSSSSSQGDGSKQDVSSHPRDQQRSPPGGSSIASNSPRKFSEKQPAARQARVPPKIQIPPSYAPPPVLSKEGSADSPGSESVNLPTPTAPSPTPLSERPNLTLSPSTPSGEWQADSPVPQSAQSTRSIRSIQSIQSIHSVQSNQSARSNNQRPKIIIPQSPPLAPWQYGSPIPLSGRSFHSVHSVRSVESVRSSESYQSYESGRTNSTVTSNPRPPEDSTPYPHSGLPLSGYPTRFANRRAFDEYITMSQAPFTPITPFDDTSPSEPRYFWRPADSLLKTPMSPEIRTAVAEPEIRTAVAEPDVTRTQNFGNFPIFSHEETPSRTHSSNSVRTTGTVGTAKSNHAAQQSDRRAASKSRKSRNHSSSRPLESAGNTIETSRLTPSGDPVSESRQRASSRSKQSRTSSRVRPVDPLGISANSALPKVQSTQNVSLENQKRAPSQQRRSRSSSRARPVDARSNTVNMGLSDLPFHAVIPDVRRRASSQPRMSRNSSKTRPLDETRGMEDNETPTNSSSRTGLPARPSSPKSRNASRSRAHERSNSMSHRDKAVEISRQLESISIRSKSTSRKRVFADDIEVSLPDRPSSPKSRNCSRDRSSEHNSSILIAASPSILGADIARSQTTGPQDVQRPPHQRTKSLSDMSFRARTESITDNERSIPCRSRTPSVGVQNLPRPSSRATSRGRQPGSVFSPPRMVPHDPSQPAGLSQADLSLLMAQRESSLKRKEPNTSPFSEPISKFERIEAIVSASCPLHGRDSTGSARPGHRASAELSSGRSASIPSVRSSSKTKEPAVSNVDRDDPMFSPSSLAETIATLTSARRSPSTPLFEPSTPKAMVLIRDEEAHAETPPMLDLTNGFSDLTCAERKVGSSSDRSKAIST